MRKSRACLPQAYISVDTSEADTTFALGKFSCLPRWPELRSESARSIGRAIRGTERRGLQGREVVENSGLSRAGRG